MIVKMYKYLFYGAKKELDQFFAKAQEVGCIEFSEKGKKSKELPGDLHSVLSAIKLLSKEKKIKKNASTERDPVEIATAVLQLKSDIEKLYEEIRLLQGEIHRVAVFGNFSMDDIDYLQEEGKIKIQFFCIKQVKRKEIELPEELIRVGFDQELDYFVAVSKEGISHPDLIEMRIDRPLGELRAELAEARTALKEFSEELHDLSKYLVYLKEAFAQMLTDYNLDKAKKSALQPIEEFFAIEGWVPEDRREQLSLLEKEFAIAAEVIEKKEEEMTPTCMRNKRMSHVGEDLVKIYDVPSIQDPDPSTWVIWAFAIFFSMIVSDGGYGAIFLLTGLLMQWKFKKAKPVAKRFFKLTILLGASCVIWGIITMNFFGINPDPTGLLGRSTPMNMLVLKKAEYVLTNKGVLYRDWVQQYPQLKNAKSAEEFLTSVVLQTRWGPDYKMVTEFTRSIFLELALLLGAIHICFSFVRNLKRSLAGIGWIFFIVGGYLYAPKMLQATSLLNFLHIVDRSVAIHYGYYLAGLGILLAIVLALIQNRFRGGFGEVMNVVQIFADVLSYLRIYALGLAGSIMAATANGIGESAGWAMGFIFVLMGHGINITLAIMGGVIHGLRLNFLEWYHYSFEGGGKLFNPLRKIQP